MQKQQEYVTFQSAYESSVTATTHRDFSAEIYEQDIFAQTLQGSNSRINIPSVTFNQPHLPTPVDTNLSNSLYPFGNNVLEDKIVLENTDLYVKLPEANVKQINPSNFLQSDQISFNDFSIPAQDISNERTRSTIQRANNMFSTQQSHEIVDQLQRFQGNQTVAVPVQQSHDDITNFPYHQMQQFQTDYSELQNETQQSSHVLQLNNESTSVSPTGAHFVDEGSGLVTPIPQYSGGINDIQNTMPQFEGGKFEGPQTQDLWTNHHFPQHSTGNGNGFPGSTIDVPSQHQGNITEQAMTIPNESVPIKLVSSQSTVKPPKVVKKIPKTKSTLTKISNTLKPSTTTKRPQKRAKKEPTLKSSTTNDSPQRPFRNPDFTQIYNLLTKLDCPGPSLNFPVSTHDALMTAQQRQGLLQRMNCLVLKINSIESNYIWALYQGHPFPERNNPAPLLHRDRNQSMVLADTI